jgi:hypothetical protein
VSLEQTLARPLFKQQILDTNALFGKIKLADSWKASR